MESVKTWAPVNWRTGCHQGQEHSLSQLPAACWLPCWKSDDTCRPLGFVEEIPRFVGDVTNSCSRNLFSLFGLSLNWCPPSNFSLISTIRANIYWPLKRWQTLRSVRYLLTPHRSPVGRGSRGTFPGEAPGSEGQKAFGLGCTTGSDETAGCPLNPHLWGTALPGCCWCACLLWAGSFTEEFLLVQDSLCPPE